MKVNIKKTKFSIKVLSLLEETSEVWGKTLNFLNACLTTPFKKILLTKLFDYSNMILMSYD